MDSLNPNMDYRNNYNPFANKKKNAHFTQEQLDYIQELLKLNWTPNQICKKFNLSESTKNTIKKRIKSGNWTANSNRNSCLTNEQRLQIQEDVKNGMPHDVICKKYNISLESLEKRIANNSWEKAKRKPKYCFNETYFDEIDTEHKAYWLGLLMADGYILSLRNREKNSREQQSFGISISLKDIELLKNLKEDLESNHPITIHKAYSSQYSGNTETCRLIFRSQHAVDSLKKWGIVENKTFFTKMPDISEELIPHFIRGYSDGDGSIASYMSFCKKDNKSYYKCHWDLTGTKELLTGILNYFDKTNLQMQQRWPERNTNNYTVKFSGRKQCKKLLGIIYNNSTIYLQRKYEKYVEIQGING